MENNTIHKCFDVNNSTFAEQNRKADPDIALQPFNPSPSPHLERDCATATNLFTPSLNCFSFA